MIVAILTAKRGDIDGVATLFGFDEFLYLVIFTWLVVGGAGRASLDYLLSRLRRPALAAVTHGAPAA